MGSAAVVFTTMVLPGVYVLTVPSVEVVVVVVSVDPVTGLVEVVCVVVVPDCANANGAMSAQANVTIIFFILPPFFSLLLIRSGSVERSLTDDQS